MNPISFFEVPCIYPVSPSNTPVCVRVPGSKSITNRALLLATLAEGTSVLDGVLFSDDSRHFLSCIQNLGFETEVDEKMCRITVTGCGGRVPRREASQYVGSAGTAARFLTAYLGVSEGIYHMDASEQMRRRPMAPLLQSLMELGCEISYEGKEGFFPFTLKGHGFGTDDITVNIEHSSQFLSALLIASCLSGKDLTIRVEGTHGMSYIQMTEAMMRQFGVCVKHPPVSSGQFFDPSSNLSSSKQNEPPRTFRIAGGQHYRPLAYRVEPDVSAACYFYAMVPLLNISVMVEGVHFDSLQGDIEFLHVLEKMGCRLSDTPQGILAAPPAQGKFPGVDVNMSAFSDQAITLAAIAPFATTPTTIRGIGHIRYQESDRMAAIVNELGKMGILCRETEHNLTIYPGKPAPATVETYDDHRMAMGFSLIGLRAPGIVIDHPDCCRKTFENYFEVLTQVVGELLSTNTDGG